MGDVIIIIAYSYLLRFIWLRFVKRGDLKFEKRDRWLFLIRTAVVAVGAATLSDKLAASEIKEVSLWAWSHNFFVYYLLGGPVIEFLDAPRAAMVSISNVFVWALARFVFSDTYSWRGNRAYWFYLVLMFFPDLVYFSAMSLRDPLIVALSGFVSVYLVRPLWWRNWLVIGAFSY